MTGSHIGFIVYDRDRRPDALLREVVHRLKSRDVRVGGLLQEGEQGSGSGCASLYLDDVGTGRRVQIFQKRDREARGCRLDASGLAEAAVWLREAIEARPDILFINRFGRQEIEGRGLREEIGAAVMADLPMVIAVGEAALSEWRSFTGGQAVSLAADADILEAWCHAARMRDAM